MKVHAHPASFDKLRMRKNLGGKKNPPHPELVEGRTVLVQSPLSSVFVGIYLRLTSCSNND
jgi:hypothetical protein